MYIKIAGGILLLGAATAAGILKSQELTERVRRLQEFKRMIIFMQGELRFHRATLAEAFENVSEKTASPFCEFLAGMAMELEKERSGFEELWRKSCKELLKQKGFQAEDGRLLELFGGGLGYLDLEVQMDSINMALVQTDEAIGNAREEERCRGRLYRTMGVTTGLLLALLIL